MAELISVTILLTTLVIGIYFIHKGVDDDSFTKQLIGFTLAISSLFIGAGVYYVLKSNSDSNPNEPKAIDVYRGNTTLEITYRDSIPVDSVVVFKDKVK